MSDPAPMLPGFEDLQPGETRMELAARRQIAKLREDGRLTDEHIIVEQMILDLSRAVGISAQKGRAAGVALAARELREAIALLPKTMSDEFADLQAELARANGKTQ
ncbi:MAG TPA: hypothetical protein VGM94_02785 [Galbitalea sp.]|jgi:hypothetical protein